MNNKTLIKKLTRLAQLLFIICLGISATVYIYLVVFGSYESAENLEVTQLQVCTEKITSSQNEDEYCYDVFPEETILLYVCGLINADTDKVDSLTIYVEKNNTQQLIYSSPVTDDFYNGYFCREIKLPETNKIGSYHVEVYFYRELVASGEFLIQ
jgi:hypothetical protein